MSYRKRLSYKESAYQFAFDPRETPKLKVKPGEEFEVETQDSFLGKFKNAEDAGKLGRSSEFRYHPAKLNPITGPIYIEGVKRGDVVIVEILDIIPGKEGCVAKIPGVGQLAHDSRWIEAQGPSIRPIKNLVGPSGTTSDGKAQFPRDDRSQPPIEWDLQPFYGTIGLAPDREVISSVTGPYVKSKGGFGGNWDVRDVKKGSRIWLPAFHEGGLLWLGDLHGSQGDGEWCGVAHEVSGLGILKCEVIHDLTIPYARIEKEDSLIQLNNGRPLERVLDEATIWLMEWLCNDYGLEKLECADLLAACPGFKYNIYQSVPPDHYTVGAEILKKYLY